MIAAWFLFGVVSGIAMLAICLAWDRQPQPARESRSERNHRLDAEAQQGIDDGFAAGWHTTSRRAR